jgi:phenylpropionate dioxygenase-like ring-hydroxylating dioxygenase large terminal subunit
MDGSGDHARAFEQLLLARDIQRRLMHHVDKGTTDGSDAAIAIDASVYTDPRWLAAEKEALFADMPVLAALSCDLPEPGDRLLFDEAGPPILIVRDSSRAVRAYLNICPHRAARLVNECIPAKRLTCPFHGWTFDLEGRLTGQPRAAAFENVPRSELGLVPVPVAEWEGLIFVRAGGGEPIDVASHLGDFAPEIARLELARAQRVKGSRLDARANWKYVLDTFGEGYHVRILHPGTVGRFVVADTVTYDGAGPHHRMSFANKAMLDFTAKPEEQWPEPELRVIYLLFPNTLIQSTPLGGGRNHIVYRIFPGQHPGESLTWLESYRSGVASDETAEPWIDAHDFQVQVVGGEDYPMAETAQRSLENGPAGQRLVFGKNELSLQCFHRRVAAAIGPALN